MLVDISLIEEFGNARLRISNTDLVSLMEDMKHRGLLQPIGLLKIKDKYIIRFGNRRLAAAKKLGWKKIDAVVSDNEKGLHDFMADNVAENMHRLDLSPLELASVCMKYKEDGFSVGEIAATLSLSKSSIDTAMRVAQRVPKEYREKTKFMTPKNIHNKKGFISAAVANAILRVRLSDKNTERLFELAKTEELSAGKIDLIKTLISQGMSFGEALKVSNEYVVKSVSFAVNKKTLEQFSPETFTTLSKKILKGEVEHIPNLI